MDRKDTLGLDDESIRKEIKDIYGEKFNELDDDEINKLTMLIREKRYYAYEMQLADIKEVYRKKSKLAVIAGTILIVLVLAMISFNILYRTNTINISSTLSTTIDCILGVFIVVFIVYYIVFFRRFKNFVFNAFNENNQESETEIDK